MHTLAIRGLSLEAGGRRLVQGLDLDARAGAVTGVLGPSGVGKSTLLRALGGLIDAAEGQVRLDGRAPEDLGWPEWRRQVTYVAQRPVMLEGSVLDNLRRPFAYAAVDATFARERVEGWLAELGLPAECLQQDARTLSVGEQQRVALVRALAIEPEVLLLDEPTSALDAASAAAVEGLLAEWSNRGRAVLAVTHDPAQAERWCAHRVDLASFAVTSVGAASAAMASATGGGPGE